MPRPPKECGPGIQRVIWDRVWAEAERDKSRAERTAMDPDANEYMRQRAISDMTKSVEQIACEKYGYWEGRAWGMSRTGWGEMPLDSAARQDWLDAGGKKPPGKLIGMLRITMYAKTSPRAVLPAWVKKVKKKQERRSR